MIEVELSEDLQNIVVAISNYGNVLSDEEMEHVFEAFYQGKAATDYKTEGKGLGLAIAQKIVMIHGGKIKVKSDVIHKKTTFYICFCKSDGQKT